MSAKPIDRPLRVAYLSEWSPYDDSGVLRKMIKQAETWRELGSEAVIFSLSPIRLQQPALGFHRIGRVVGRLTQSQVDRFRWARLAYVNKVISARMLAGAILDFRPDLIYYRQCGPWYPGLIDVFRLRPTVIEVNSDERAEHRFWGGMIRAGLHEALQSRVLRSVSGVVAVTREIGSLYTRFGVPIGVIPNSFMGEPPLESSRIASMRPRLVFVGSRFSAPIEEHWHGIDKVIELARELPEFDFDIAGVTAADCGFPEVTRNLTFHGYLGSAELESLYCRADVGISTLAAYRHNLQEGCSLKVREYLMHRLPVVLAYREAESSLNDAEYVLRIENSPTNVADSIGKIRTFVGKWHGRRVSHDLSFLSAKAKEEERLKFFRTIIASRLLK